MKTKFEQSNTWQHARKIEIKKIIDNDNFPCIFGKKASKNNTIQWLLLNHLIIKKTFSYKELWTIQILLKPLYLKKDYYIL